MLTEIDFILYQNKQQEKGFTFKNDDDTYYDLSSSTVKMELYKGDSEASPTNIVGDINVSTGTVTFVFTTQITDTLGKFEYLVIETKSGADNVLVKGNITLESYVPFSDSINAFLGAELPEGLTLSTNFINQKTRYWRLFLQEAFDISDANIDIDASWPLLVNALIAKLIAHDALIVALRGNILLITGGTTSSSTSTQGGGIKSIETGPSRVEFLPAGEVVTNLIKGTASGGGGLLSDLQDVLCGLANKLEVKLPMCSAPRVGGIFSVYRNPDWAKITLQDVMEQRVVSIG